MNRPIIHSAGDARDPRPKVGVSSLLSPPAGQAPAPGAFLGGRAPVPLAGRQMEVLRAIAHHIRRFGYSPSFDEIRADLGLASRTSLRDTLVRLRNKGWLRWLPGRSRSFEILHRPPPQAFVIVNAPEARLVPLAEGRP